MFHEKKEYYKNIVTLKILKKNIEPQIPYIILLVLIKKGGRFWMSSLSISCRKVDHQNLQIKFIKSWYFLLFPTKYFSVILAFYKHMDVRRIWVINVAFFSKKKVFNLSIRITVEIFLQTRYSVKPFFSSSFCSSFSAPLLKKKL